MTTCTCRQHLNAAFLGGVFSLTHFLINYNLQHFLQFSPAGADFVLYYRM